MRILFITLEFRAAAFSGNGIYAQAQVRGLVGAGCEVLVVCGKPRGHAGAAEDNVVEVGSQAGHEERSTRRARCRARKSVPALR